jgi:O-antigen biosynthesis protein
MSEIGIGGGALRFDEHAQEVTIARPGLIPLPAHTSDDLGQAPHRGGPRPATAGKFLRAGGETLWVKGVTYGTFRSDEEAGGYPAPESVQRDFAAMRASGINTVRTYTVPPRWLLDCAHEHGLRVMVGLPWEQHIAFLDERGLADDIVRRVQAGARACAGHPALFCFAVGNEIPGSIVRWHGRRRTERFIRRLYDAVKTEDAEALVTYVNYPTTEYLQLPFLDVVCFNVYLESEEKLSSYLARLQNLAGERPLMLAELGLDSRRNGEEAQGTSLAWQLRTAFASGCAGAFVFSWTDEWFRGGYDIDDWDFGLTTRERAPKAALFAVQRAYDEVPFPADIRWPRVSVVVCSYNGSRTIRDTLEGLGSLDYPDFEVIVVNDGSTDATPAIAAEYPVRLISTPNRGLSNARNTGWEAATGEIIAYIDDDAYPPPHWLKYLAYAFLTTDHVGVGGPNIAPPGDGPIADCVANAPGGPVHVLVTDTIAEHIPGCNMAFRRSALAAIGGFDPRYRAAGDDVDLCWRLMDNGGTIGFHAGAMNWHHRRNSLKMYWRQQKGYGKAEALLEEKWPERYNAAGHLSWGGRLYGRGVTLPMPVGRPQVYGGVWGTAAYQSLYEPGTASLLSLTLMPEWLLVVAALGILSATGIAWSPLLFAFPLFVVAAGIPLIHAALAASRARYPAQAATRVQATQRWVLTCCMHLIQPAARLIGRVRHGLTPWRRRGSPARASLAAQRVIWSERWFPSETWIAHLEATTRERGAVVMRGGNFDEWDLHFRGGAFGSARTRITTEEHGGGRQLVRFQARTHVPRAALATLLALAVLAVLACVDSAWIAAGVLATLSGVLGVLMLRDCALSRGTWAHAVETLKTSIEAEG